jgi:hypothetical protein
MKKSKIAFIAFTFILMLSINFSADAALYYFVGDRDNGPATLSLDSYNHQFVETSVYRTWQFNWSVENTGSSSLPNVKLILPFVWSNVAGSMQGYIWDNTNQEWENSGATGNDGSIPAWVRVNNVPLNSSGSPTSSPDLFILMSNTDLSLTSTEPVAPYYLPQLSVNSSDSFPAWNIDSSLEPGETAMFTTYLQAERGWTQFFIEPKVVATPIPTSVLLLTSGLIGLVTIRRRLKR